MARRGLKAQQAGVTVTAYLYPEDIAWLEKIAEKLGKSRSEMLTFCIENARDDLAMMASVGLKPERLQKIGNFLAMFRLRAADFVKQGELTFE